jgi:hypothetical protein
MFEIAALFGGIAQLARRPVVALRARLHRLGALEDVAAY